MLRWKDGTCRSQLPSGVSSARFHSAGYSIHAASPLAHVVLLLITLANVRNNGDHAVTRLQWPQLMANLEHLAKLKEGVEAWNLWRNQNPEILAPDLSGAFLPRSNLNQANLYGAILSKADLRGADLDSATLIRTNLEGADLTGCNVYGISAWDVKVEGAIQSNLVITPRNESSIMVDNLEVAQFIYLLLNNKKIRSVIDTITSKVVLILGRFTEERKPVLEAIRNELRQRDYLPVLFDFEKPDSRNLTETVRTLAHLARFVIADITDAKSIPQELMAIVPQLPHLPVQPLLVASQHEYSMFKDLRDYPWVLAPVLYDDQETLLTELSEKVIAPAETRARAQTAK
jgi:hypothetical protein